MSLHEELMNEGGHFRLPEQQPPFEIPSSSTLSLSGPSVSHYYTSPSTRPFSYKPIPVATRTDVHQPKSWPAQSGSAIFGRYPIASQLQTPNGGFTDPAYQADEASIFADNFRRGPREDFNHPSSLQFPANIAANHVEAVGVSSSAHGNRTSNGKPRPSIEARKENIPAHTSSSTSEQDNKSVNKTTIFDDMPQGAQSWDRGPENSAVHRPASVRSSMSRQSFHNDPSAQEDGRRSGLSSRDVDDPAKQTILRARQVDAYTEAKTGLPNEKGFPIQIGSELFRLSGASIMSDAPSYFSKFFEDQLRQNEDNTGTLRTLYIDRDPNTFQDIARHLQGYHVQPRDGGHYVRLFADAQFYSLPRLIKQLFDSEIFMRIGEENFQIPRDIFSSPGDSPNFFTLGFAVFFNSPEEVFPGLDREGLLRPPSIIPPNIQGRSASTFADLLQLLRGYPLHIKNNEHRAELLRDSRYYHLRGLEQKLIQHHISFNVQLQKSEIVLRLEDIRQSGVSFVGDVSPSDRSPLAGWVNYGRPFVDETNFELILEVGDQSHIVDIRSMRADFYGQAKARITSLFQVVSNKMNLPTNVPLGLMMQSGGAAAQPVSPGNTPLSEDRVKVLIGNDAHVILDGEEYSMESSVVDHFDYNSGNQDNLNDSAGFMSDQLSANSWTAESTSILPTSHSVPGKPPSRKRKRRGSLDDFGEWVVRKSQWRLRVQPRPDQPDQNGQKMEIVLHAVKLDALSGQKGRNAKRPFLN